MIDRQTIDRIMDATNIVDVVSDFVSLRKRGTSYKGLCPFHDDTTPSFSVSPAKGVYKCFACGKAGNAVNFIMEHEQLTYPDALRWLARKYHIDIEERELTDEERRQQSERESMFIVNEWAADYFHNLLLNDVDGRAIGLQYFRNRGFRDDIVERFKLGFCLNKRDAMSREAIKRGYNPEFLVKVGLAYERNSNSHSSYSDNNSPAHFPTDESNDNLNSESLKGESNLKSEASPQKQPSNYGDRFSNRVIFPWFGVGGKIIAFGGRLLDSRTKGVAQKYVNSPDSDIYHKDHELYGIFQAKQRIAKEDRVYMVEGYTDVISMHQCGIENVVANSGTALSVHQIKLLRRFTQNITLIYDGDDAGIHAALRGTDMLLAEGMNVKILLLPDQEDPDSFARKHTTNEFRQYIEDHQTDFIEFKTQVLLNGVSDPIKRSEAINSIVRSISVITDPIIKATYLKDCSSRIGIQEQTLIAQMNKFIVEEKQRRQRGNGGLESQGSVESYPTNTGESSQVVSQRLTAADIHIDKRTKEQSQLQTLEKLIVQAVVRNGDEVIFKNVQIDDENTIDLTVAEYVLYDLEADNAKLTNPLYNQIIEEAVNQLSNDDFKAETYFLQHPNAEISQLASQLCIDNVNLSKSLQIKTEEDTLKNRVRHLMLDYRRRKVDIQLKTLQLKLSQTKSYDQQTKELLEQINKLMEKRNVYAKNLGNNVL